MIFLDMKNATIAWSLVVVFFTTSVLFAGLYLSARHTLQRTQTALDMTEKSEAELRDNVQAAIAQSDKKDKADAIFGIYYCESVPGRNQVDLRSGGAAVFYYDGGRQQAGKTTWKLDGDTILIGTQKFTVEQTDLIDYRGNRWLHIR